MLAVLMRANDSKLVDKPIRTAVAPIKPTMIILIRIILLTSDLAVQVFADWKLIR